MPMWAICHRHSNSVRCEASPGSAVNSGFTLIEMLVVLVLVGLLTAVVLPNMERMASSARHRTERDAIIGRLGELGYRAFLSGKAITLTSSPTGASAVSASYPIKLPKGWRLQVPSPVVYAFNGICGGGEVVLLAPDHTQEKLVLRPPVCKVEDHAAD
jgi:prepilin-type N-terminal cleavage/methylation domain-containing protein